MEFADTDISPDGPSFVRMEEKKRILDDLRPLSSDAVDRLLEDFRIRFTYHSDAIEGNTLSLNETKLVIMEGITIGGKPLKDHIEARNDAMAFDLVVKMVKEEVEIDHLIVQEIHEMVTRGMLMEAGRYRSTNVGITGSRSTPPPYYKLVEYMDGFIEEVARIGRHPVIVASFIHHSLVGIHPFVDGNGRVARLLMNLYLMRHGYPPVVLKQEDRERYYRYLQLADSGDLTPFTRYVIGALNESLSTYLSAFSDGDRLAPLKELTSSTGYSQEYLSLRARQGKLDGVKIENVWHTSERMIKEYVDRKSR